MYSSAQNSTSNTHRNFQNLPKTRIPTHGIKYQGSSSNSFQDIMLTLGKNAKNFKGH